MTTQTDLMFDIDMFIKMKEYEGYAYDIIIDTILEYVEIADELD